MTFSVQFSLAGIPKPQGSKRGFVNKKTKQVIMVESGGQALTDWRGDLKRAAQDGMMGRPPIEGPVGVKIEFRLQRPKSHPKTKATWPDTRPDLDKLARAVLDAMTQVCFRDDSQVTRLDLSKIWATDGQSAGCQVDVWQATERTRSPFEIG